MAIKFNNGKEIQFFASSGALGFDGRGWCWNRLCFPEKIYPGIYPPFGVCPVSKTITLYEKHGNKPLPYFKIRPLFEKRRLVGWVNALGLPNKGFHWFLHNVFSKIDLDKKDFIVSLAGTKEELCYMALRLNDFNITAIEINFSCPNTGEDLKENTKELVKTLRGVMRHTRHDLIAKISCAQDFVRIASEAEGLAAAVSFNSAPWRLVFPAKRSPFERQGGGGVSGKKVRWFHENMAVKIRRLSKMPVIMPVWDEEDLRVNDEIGASAHSFGSVFIASPTWPARAVKNYFASKNSAKMVP